VTPDLAILAHAIGNGYPLAAVAGKKEIMRSQYDNFISSTYYSDTVSLAAGVAVLNELRTKPVVETINRNGKVLRDGIAASIEKHGVKAKVAGRSDHFILSLDYGDQNDKVHTLYMQEMISRGIYWVGGWFMCFTHTQQDIHRILAANDEAFEFVAKAIERNEVEEMLRAPVRETVSTRPDE